MKPWLPDHNDLTAAFQSVKENHGCAGVDGVTIEAFEAGLKTNIGALEYELARSTYFPLPLLRILVDKGKGNGETRALSVPAVRDRVVQTAVLQKIEPILERQFEECSYAYRKGRSVRQAVYRIKDFYEQGYRWVVDADIDAFFDSVDHCLLMEKLGRHVKDESVLSLVEQWVKAEVWDGAKLVTLEKGIPQGSPVSPILANLFLDELDEAMLRGGFAFIRFADDFVILAKSKEQARDALEVSKKLLDALSLHLDEEDIVTFDEGFKYLGVTFLKSLVMVPFDRPKRKKGVVCFPPPFDLQAYLLKKKMGC